MSGLAQRWTRVGTRFLPFADAASADLPLARLLRLSLFQISCGLTAVLLTGTLNRVMIVELGLPAGLVALMVALPLLFAPARVLVGFKSDHHRSALGWKRVPYLWFGTLLQFGGLAIMPFALLVMTGDGRGPAEIGIVGGALAFLLAGAGMHMVQTAGLALATDLAPPQSRPRVVALLYVMLLAGMMASALLIGSLLGEFSPTRLVAVVQGAAVLSLLLNLVALWKQEARAPRGGPLPPPPPFRRTWGAFLAPPRTRRLLLTIGLGAAGFAMLDVLLEPYGGEILAMGVGRTTWLTGVWAAGSLMAFGYAARALGRSMPADPLRLAALGVLAGIIGLTLLILSAPFRSEALVWASCVLTGFGVGLFAVTTIIAAMDLADSSGSGLALGAWGAVHASAAGIGMVVAGGIRDWSSAAGDPALGYSIVWHLEIALLFLTLVALGPLVRRSPYSPNAGARPFGLQEFPA